MDLTNKRQVQQTMSRHNRAYDVALERRDAARALMANPDNRLSEEQYAEAEQVAQGHDAEMAAALQRMESLRDEAAQHGVIVSCRWLDFLASEHATKDEGEVPHAPIDSP